MENYLELVGAVLKQAITDYRGKNDAKTEASKKMRKLNHDDAKDFLFTNRLPNFLKEFGIDRVVDVEGMRREARKGYEYTVNL